MQLGRYQVSTLRPPPILSIDFSRDGRLFAVALETGYEVWRTCPLALVRRRVLPGTLARALPLPHSPLIALQGGGKSPLYSPNKVIVYHDGLGVAVAELEFNETVRGLACRSSTIVVALFRRVIAFQYGVTSGPTSDVKGKGKAKEGTSEGDFQVTKIGEWETANNERGLIAIASSPDSTLLAIPGRQQGHVQLINLSPCRRPSQAAPTRTDRNSILAFRSPIILAHEHELSSLACTASGSHIVTTSERGTLLRVWNTHHGRLERELRRGMDRAEMWGAQFEDAVLAPDDDAGQASDDRRRDEQRSKGGRVVGWSDKGTVHVWGLADDDARQEGSKGSTQPASLTHMLSRNLPLPKYFSSSPSTALYRLPRKNPHAFASTVSAAAEAARLPSMKMREAVEEDGDWNERFVVSWVEVEVEVNEGEAEAGPGARDRARPSTGSRKTSTASTVGSGLRGEMGMGIGMGTREERRSFGSEETSRTATPTTPRHDMLKSKTPGLGASYLARVHSGGSSARRASPRGIESPSAARMKDKDGPRTRIAGAASAALPGPKRTRLERQLIAITFGGDWYRLRIPDEIEVDEEGQAQRKTGRKCELVEYRRLNVGGGGW